MAASHQFKERFVGVVERIEIDFGCGCDRAGKPEDLWSDDRHPAGSHEPDRFVPVDAAMSARSP